MTLRCGPARAARAARRLQQTTVAAAHSCQTCSPSCHAHPASNPSKAQSMCRTRLPRHAQRASCGQLTRAILDNSGKHSGSCMQGRNLGDAIPPSFPAKDFFPSTLGPATSASTRAKVKKQMMCTTGTNPGQADITTCTGTNAAKTGQSGGNH